MLSGASVPVADLMRASDEHSLVGDVDAQTKSHTLAALEHNALIDERAIGHRDQRCFELDSRADVYKPKMKASATQDDRALVGG